MGRSTILGSCLLALTLAVPVVAQQAAGDREVGVGGALIHNHSGNDGSVFFQVSLGYFQSNKNFFGVEVTPIVTYGDGASISSVVNGTYRRFFGSQTGRVFPFFGVGAGTFLSRSSGDTSAGLMPKAEIGIKSYVSQKTSIEFSYSWNILVAGAGASGGIADRSLSIAMVSLRHLF